MRQGLGLIPWIGIIRIVMAFLSLLPSIFCIGIESGKHAAPILSTAAVFSLGESGYKVLVAVGCSATPPLLVNH